ncbi:MAG: hypothetical protein JKY82_10210 [Rhizobiaceae bacterium]|nr:hypothetical protein [Rhizobiaceae bacterium]
MKDIPADKRAGLDVWPSFSGANGNALAKQEGRNHTRRLCQSANGQGCRKPKLTAGIPARSRICRCKDRRYERTSSRRFCANPIGHSTSGNAAGASRAGNDGDLLLVATLVMARQALLLIWLMAKSL